MTTTDIKQIIERNKNDIAFVVGNGINRYPIWFGKLFHLKKYELTFHIV